ncbi:unnamed protein product, partial [Mesorhabditis spiculigera]
MSTRKPTTKNPRATTKSTGALCPAIEKTLDPTKTLGAAKGLDCGVNFCRSVAGMNICFAQNDICPYQTKTITSTTVKGPADSVLVCPATTKCVSGTTNNGFTGNFCIAA